ncbi:MAG: MFS transporter [Comamonas sp.]|nr:MFS transporter [Comamonas sp.]
MSQPTLCRSPFWFIVAAGISVALHISKLPPSVALLQQELGISLMDAGFLLSTVQFAGMLLGLAVGLSADRWGLKRSMLAGLLLMATGSVIGALANSFIWLLLCRVLEGLGFLVAVMPGPGLIRRHIPAAQLGRRMSLWSTYMPTGMTLGLIASPWLLQIASWRVLWLVLGGISLLAAVAVMLQVPPDPAPCADSPNADAGWQPRLLLTLRSSGPWLVAISFMVYAGQWIAIVGFLPTVYQAGGVSAQLAGLLTALVSMVNIAGNVAAGQLQHAGWTPRRILQTGFTAMGVCTVLAFLQVGGEPLLPLWLRFIAIAAFSAIGGLIPGSLFILAVRLSPSTDTVSTTVGFMQQCSSMGQMLGPPLVAAVATWVGGWQWTWVVTGSFALVGWGLAIGIQRQWEKNRPSR